MIQRNAQEWLSILSQRDDWPVSVSPSDVTLSQKAVNAFNYYGVDNALKTYKQSFVENKIFLGISKEVDYEESTWLGNVKFQGKFIQGLVYSDKTGWNLRIDGGLEVQWRPYEAFKNKTEWTGIKFLDGISYGKNL